MKKNNYFLLMLAMLFTFSLNARKVVVNTTATLTTAFNAAQDLDTISIRPGVYNVGTSLKIPSTGLIVLTSNKLDSVAIVQMEMQATASVLETAFPKKPSLIFKNLHIQGRYGAYDSGNGYIINLSAKYFSLDTLAFRNCEISKSSRCLFRSGDGTGTGTKSGFIESFEITNCYIHEMNSKDHIWPLVYMGHLPMYVNINKNTFCDMPCAKSILQLSKMEVATGRNAEINFLNNTVVTTWARTEGLISASNYLGEEAIYNIKNNIILLPNWADKYNMRKDSSLYVVPPVIRCVGGIITATNNVVDSLRPWLSGQILDVDGQGGFVVIDTTNTKKLKDLNVSWSTFADAPGNDFTYFSTSPLATAGTNGSALGDPRWVKTFTTPRTLVVTANNAKAVVTPGRAYYEDGSIVKVTATAVDGYIFKGWKKTSDGSLLSIANPYSFTINSDIEIMADYAILQERKVAISISGSTSASYTITPTKAIYFEGDEITVTLNKHFINDFLGWSDANTDLVRKISISGDVALTANFTEHPYIVAWDFHQLTTNNASFAKLESNHAKDALNKGYMMYMSADTVAKIETRNNKFTTLGKELYNCLTRKTPIENKTKPSYVYIKFSTKGLANLKVKSIYATDNSFFKVQKMDYSVNGAAFTTFATDTISGNIDQIWRPFTGTLPVAAENQDSVAVRWVSDPTTEQLFVTGVTSYALEQIYISNIIVIDNNFSAVNKLDTDKNYKIFSIADKLLINAETNSRAEVYSMMGLKVKDIVLRSGLNETSGLHTGIYIVRIGSQVQKVLIK